jgi:hypothetical protein
MRTISKLFSLALFTATVTGCVSNNVTPEQQLQVACDGAATVVSALADYRAAGKLSEEAVATVEGVRPVVNRICTERAVSTAKALPILQQILDEMVRLKLEAESK